MPEAVVSDRGHAAGRRPGPGSTADGDAAVLPATLWRSRQRAHAARVDGWLAPHRARRARGEKHPVYDFLFEYYSFRPAALRRWSPGAGVVLLAPPAGGAPPADGDPAAPPWSSPGGCSWQETETAPGGEARGWWLDPGRFPAHRRDFLDWAERFLAATTERPPLYGCAGLHEWAMVYRQDPAARRHDAWPQRLPPPELARFVESQPVCCTHFDAFRFFTPAARPLNRHQPRRETCVELDQRGCLHVNMDLYKLAYKLSPWIEAELVADAFALAVRAREIDMRASPYDLRALGPGWEPIAVETVAGRAEYAAHQRGIAGEAVPVRARLLAACGLLRAAARDAAPGGSDRGG